MRKTPAEPEQAIDRFVEALALAEALGMAPLQARCHLSLGVLHDQAGQADEARSELSQAIEMLKRMQMGYWLGGAERLLAPR